MMAKTVSLMLIILATCCLRSFVDGGYKTTARPVTCGSNLLRCHDGSNCISEKDVCNHVKDCPDMSDESLQLCKAFSKARGGCDNHRIKCRIFGCSDIIEGCMDNLYCRNDINVQDLCNYIEKGVLPANEDLITCKKTNLEPVVRYLSMAVEKAAFQSNRSCPPFYHDIEGRCVAVFEPGLVTWKGAELFCNSLSGNLTILSNLTHYYTILKFFRNKGIQSDFWIGASYDDPDPGHEEGWKWTNGEKVEMGAPFWAVVHASTCSQQSTSTTLIMPQNSMKGKCVSLRYDYNYYFSDENCDRKAAPLCSFAPSATFDERTEILDYNQWNNETEPSATFE